jgi:uncharacterized membrane protein HdeD (DUF308 family)
MIEPGIGRSRMTTEPFETAGRALARSLRHHWKLFLAEGIILVLLGCGALIVPLIAGLAITILFGWLFLLIGVTGLVTTFAMRHAPGFWWSLISALLAIVLGGWVLFFPGMGLISLTYLLIAFFIAEGVVTIMYALDHRRELSQRWGWMLLSGVVDLFVAVIILLGLPGSFAWALGLIVGINLLFGGASMIAMALAARAE